MSASNVPAAEIQAMNKRALLICTPQVGTLFRCSKYGVGIVRQVTRDPACSCLPSKKIPQSTPRLGKESQKTTPWLSKPSKSHPSNSHSVNPPSKNISRNAESLQLPQNRDCRTCLRSGKNAGKGPVQQSLESESAQ